jgi:hypothetical protein
MQSNTLLRYSLLASVILWFNLLYFYYFQRALLAGSMTVLLSFVVITLVAMFLAARSELLSDSEKLPLRATFGIFVVASIVFFAFDYTLFNFWDKSLVEVQKTAMENYFRSQIKTPNELNQRIEDIRAADLHSIGATVQTFAIRTIVGFLLAYLVAWIARRLHN